MCPDGERANYASMIVVHKEQVQRYYRSLSFESKGNINTAGPATVCSSSACVWSFVTTTNDVPSKFPGIWTVISWPIGTHCVSRPLRNAAYNCPPADGAV